MIVTVGNRFVASLAFVASLVAWAPASAVTADDVKGPRISSPAPTIDLGDVFQGDAKTTSFTLENLGDAPLGLLRIVPKCGCTIPKLRLPATGEERDIPMLLGNEPFLTLAPGEKCEIAVRFNSSGQPLHKIHKEITVESTDKEHSPFKLTLQINLLRVAWFEPTVLQLGKVTRGNSLESSVDVWPGEGVKFEVQRISPIEHLETSFESTDLPDGRKRYHVKVKLLPTAPIGDFTRTLAIETTVATAPIVKIPIFALVQPSVIVETGNRFNSSALDFGALPTGQGGETTFEISNACPELPYVPKSVTIDSTVASNLTASIEEIEAGVRYRVRVKVDKALVQRFFKGTLTVHADHAEVPELVVPFQGLIKQS